jgi:nucleotidyltransferase/DNA polymerase involved in DNA repair
MTYPITEIDGLGAAAAARLKANGIRTTEKLLEAARTMKGRKALAALTGLPAGQLLDWANIADCMRVRGMGKTNIELLRAAGVNTVRDLIHRNPAKLADAMKSANEKRKLTRAHPTEKSVGQMIAHARKLPLKITY